MTSANFFFFGSGLYSPPSETACNPSTDRENGMIPVS